VAWNAASSVGFSLGPYVAISCVAAAVLFPLAGEYWNRPSNPIGYVMAGERRWLLLVLVASFAIRLLFMFFCSVYPDEYAVLQVLNSQPLSRPIEFAVNYSQLAGIEWVHPPLGFLLMSIGYSIWPTIYGARMIVLALSMISVAAVYRIVKDLGAVESALTACAFYALLPQSVLFLTPATTDSFANLFGILSLLLYLVGLKKNLGRYILLSGFFLGLSFLSKLAIPFEWAIGILLVTLAYKGRFSFLGVAYGAAAVTYAPWLIINREAAVQPNLNVISEMIHSIFPPRLDIGPVTVLERLSYGSRFISLSELVLQMMIWLTPLLILLAATGVLQSLTERSRKSYSLALWLLLPLLGAIPKIRDVRYLLPIAVPFVYFSSRGLNVNGSTLRRRLKSAAIGFTLIFLAMSFVVAQQEYSGPPEAAAVLESLGLSNATILTNFPRFQTLLPNITIVMIGPNTTPAQALELIISRRVDAAVILHQIRGAWPQPPPETVDALKPLFGVHVSGGPSSFSWYEIFYGTPPVACLRGGEDPFVTEIAPTASSLHQISSFIVGESRTRFREGSLCKGWRSAA
jgi:4-amino-4-deoxy-L-arabinose transferase-like glycosyltransferase